MDRVLAILGPTATGKSSLAMSLSASLGAEIVNADALQVYKGLDIGTAKPTEADRSRVRHHLVDIKSPQERFSAGEFARLARRVLVDVGSRQSMAIVVGGSGLYLKALFDGISQIPEVPPEVREALLERLQSEGLEALRSELARVDPRTASRLAAGDTQRVMRALEVAEATGRPLSDWIAQKPPGAARIPARKVGLTLERSVLYDRIRARVESMVEDGWLREVESLLNQGYSGSEPAFQAIGYRQIVEHLRGSLSLAETVAEICRATRNYAKRQLTWFRRDPEVVWHDASEPRLVHQQLLATLVS